ncbi:hypothetical protein C0J52_12521 [Blattella germanica]|nr:hypothetical protein C0J52_12521 [Blattella germanica]
MCFHNLVTRGFSLWTMDSIFDIFVIIIYQRFQQINEIFVVPTENNNSHQVGIKQLHSTHEQGENIEKYSLNLLQGKTKVISSIRILRKLQEQLCDIAIFVNETHCLQILFSISLTFFQITWFTFAFITFFLNPYSHLANRTADLVHKLINDTKDPEIREELQLFSLQLLHRKINFTACGFFPLDFTLLYSV